MSIVGKGAFLLVVRDPSFIFLRYICDSLLQQHAVGCCNRELRLQLTTRRKWKLVYQWIVTRVSIPRDEGEILSQIYRPSTFRLQRNQQDASLH